MKYTKETADKIIKLIRDGNFASIAYGAVGISKDTFYRWLRERPDFSDSIKKAKAERITSLISAIKNDSSFQSKAWMLERLEPKRFHLPTKAEAEMLEELRELKEAVTKIKNNGNYQTAN